MYCDLAFNKSNRAKYVRLLFSMGKYAYYALFSLKKRFFGFKKA